MRSFVHRKWPLRSVVWPLWHLWQQWWQHQCDYHGYPVKEHRKTNSPVLFPPHYDNLLKSYSCLKFSSWSLHCEPHCKNGLGAKKLSTWFPMLKSWKPKHVFFRKWSKKKESNPVQLIWFTLCHSVSLYQTWDIPIPCYVLVTLLTYWMCTVQRNS